MICNLNIKELIRRLSAAPNRDHFPSLGLIRSLNGGIIPRVNTDRKRYRVPCLKVKNLNLSQSWIFIQALDLRSQSQIVRSIIDLTIFLIGRGPFQTLKPLFWSNEEKWSKLNLIIPIQSYNSLFNLTITEKTHLESHFHSPRTNFSSLQPFNLPQTGLVGQFIP